MSSDQIELTKINVIGERFFHVFEDSDGNTVEEETTEDDYRQLGTDAPVNPVKEGHVWKLSFSDHKYDTVSGRMEEGCYAENGEKYKVMVNGILECQLDKSEIVDHKISAVKIESLKAELLSIKATI